MLLCDLLGQIWDGVSYDHRASISAHTVPIVAITSFFASPPVVKSGGIRQAIIGKGTVIITAAADGSMRVSAVCDALLRRWCVSMVWRCRCVVQAWKAATGEMWEVQFADYHRQPVCALQVVYSGVCATPVTAMPAPIESGVLPAAAVDASDGATVKSGLPVDPPVTVPGITPAHTQTRLFSIAADGRLAVFDLYTGKSHSCGLSCASGGTDADADADAVLVIHRQASTRGRGALPSGQAEVGPLLT